MIETEFPSLADVKQRVIAAVVNLYRQDWELFHINANERSITHKLAEYLQREFPNWNVDCEYNRRGRDIKKLSLEFCEEIKPDDVEAKTVFPDIIVHQRRIQQNLLVVEVQKVGGLQTTRDKEKLKAFGEDPAYSYQYALFLCLGPRGSAEALVFESGLPVTSWTAEVQELLKELGYGE